MKSLISLRKRGLALFLVLTMCLSLLQVTASITINKGTTLECSNNGNGM